MKTQTHYQVSLSRREYRRKRRISRLIFRTIVIIWLLSLTTFSSLKAQPQPPSGPGPNPTPIDGVVGLFMAVGAGYIAIRKKRNSQDSKV